MPTDYAGDSDLFPATIPVLDDGDDADAATIAGVALEGLADRTAFLDNLVRPPSLSIARMISSPMQPGGDGTGWAIGATMSPTQVTSGSSLFIPLLLPNGCTLNSFEISIDPAGGHGGLPTLPSIDIISINLNDTGVQEEPTYTDPAASVGAYEPRHTLTMSSIGVVIDTTQKRYFARLNGEAGANYVAGLKVVAARVDFTVTALDPGAS